MEEAVVVRADDAFKMTRGAAPLRSDLR